MSKLTAVQVRNAKPKDKPYKLSDGYGMYLHVAKSGRKTWKYRFRVDGRESTYTLGEYPAMSLEAARKERVEKRDMVKENKNPTAVKKQNRKREERENREAQLAEHNTFESLAREWHKVQKSGWSTGHAAHILNSLEKDAFPSIGYQPIEEITPPDVLQIVRDIEKRGALETVRKVLQRMNNVFRYAIQTGRATYNPAADMKGALKPKTVKNMTALKEHELPAFLKRLRNGDIHTTNKLAIEFTILTAARTAETRFASWSEIDLDKKVWTIPGSRTKNGKPHRVPLSPRVITIIEEAGKLYGQHGHLFPGTRQGADVLSENTMLYGLYRLGYHSKATMHGFRSTFSTIANEAGFSPDLIEKSLAHSDENKTRAAYNRGDYLEQRRGLMDWWADLLRELESQE